MIMQKKSIQYNAVQNILLTLSNMLFPLITFPYVSRVLSVEGLGKANFYNTLGSYALMVAGLGIGTYGIKACAINRTDRDKLSKTVLELTCIKIFSTCAVVAAMTIGFFVIKKFHEDAELFFAEQVLVMFGIFNIEWLFSGIEEYAYITKRSIAFKIASLVLLFLLVNEANDYVAYVWITVFASCGNYLFNVCYSRRYITYRKKYKPQIKKHLKPTLTLFGTVLAVSVYTSLDTLMLGFYCGDEAVGYYTVAVKVKSILLALINSFSVVLLPRLSYYAQVGANEHYNSILGKSINIVFFSAVPMAAFFILNAPNTIRILSGEKYLDASWAMQILMLILVISGFSNVMGNQILIPNNKEKFYLSAIATGAVADLCLNLVLISKYSYNGVALATVIAEMIQATMQTWFSRKYITGNINYREIGKVVVAAIISAISARLILAAFEMKSGFACLIESGVVFVCVYISILFLLKSNTIMLIKDKILSIKIIDQIIRGNKVMK